MFDRLSTSPKALDRYSGGPLFEERLGYLAHCAAQGSTWSSLRLIAQHRLVIVDYLQLQEVDSLTVEEVEATAERWVSRQPQPHTHNAIDYRHGRWRFISDARQWLTFLGRLRTIEAPRRPYADLIEGFMDFMIRERGLSQHTVRIRCWHVEQFLNRFWERHRSFDEVTIADIDAAVPAKATRMDTRGPRFKITLTHSVHSSATTSNVAGAARA